MTGFWTPERDEEVKRLRRDGLSYTQIGAMMGCTRNAALGRHSRLMKPPKKAERQTPLIKQSGSRGKPVGGNGWTEGVLTEPWTVYSARKKAERAAKRAMA